jgi:hypothetical protein
MKQLTLAAVGLERYAQTTRRAGFLAEMERVVPWPALCALIEPFYPKPGICWNLTHTTPFWSILRLDPLNVALRL